MLADHHDRITWDAPIHSIADIEALPFAPRMVNIKPSRIGGLREAVRDLRLLRRARHRRVRRRPVRARRPAAARRSTWRRCFTPTRPNDLAPSGYNENDPPPGLPASPLPPRPTDIGLPLGGELMAER